MKIVSWNCKFGFSEEKAIFIKNYNADLYNIQECLETDLKCLNNIFTYKTFFCDSVESNYGIGLFSDKYNFQILQEHNKKFRYIVPYIIFDEESEFILFSIWTKDKNEYGKKIEYTEQTWKAINYNNYAKYLSGSIILAGDFNSNNYWNEKYIKNKKPSHNDIIEKLKQYGIESAYHKHNKCIDGNENDPTLLWQMDKNKQFHIDYFFVSKNYSIKNVSVGTLDEWEKDKLSDHCPIIIEID